MSKTFRKRKLGKGNRNQISEYFIDFVNEKLLFDNFTEEHIQKTVVKLYHSDFFNTYSYSFHRRKAKREYNSYTASAKRSKHNQDMHCIVQFPPHIVQEKDLSLSDNIDTLYHEVELIQLNLKIERFSRYW